MWDNIFSSALKILSTKQRGLETKSSRIYTLSFNIYFGHYLGNWEETICVLWRLWIRHFTSIRFTSGIKSRLISHFFELWNDVHLIWTLRNAFTFHVTENLTILYIVSEFMIQRQEKYLGILFDSKFAQIAQINYLASSFFIHAIKTPPFPWSSIRN